MTKYNIVGGLLCLGGLLLVLFQTVSSIMTPGEIVWKSLSIVDIFDPENFKWIDTISWGSIQKFLTYIVTMPLYLLLICAGVLSFIIGVLVKK
jgi:hypothetical protein